MAGGRPRGRPKKAIGVVGGVTDGSRPVLDRKPDQLERHPLGEVPLLHIPTMIWTLQSMEKLLQGHIATTKRAGRGHDAEVLDWARVKVIGFLTREWAAQRQRVSRATRREKEAVEIEIRLATLKARELNAVLDEIEVKRKKAQIRARQGLPRGQHAPLPWVYITEDTEVADGEEVQNLEDP